MDLPMLPTLEGQVTFDHITENWFFKGLWAMTPQQLRTGIRSAFHYVHKDNKESSDPRTGSYSGYFMLKAADADQKVLEDDVSLVFDEKDGEQHVTGQGSNQYGAFTLEGKFENGKLVLSKKYVAAPVANTVSRVRKRSPAALASGTSAKKTGSSEESEDSSQEASSKGENSVISANTARESEHNGMGRQVGFKRDLVGTGKVPAIPLPTPARIRPLQCRKCDCIFQQWRDADNKQFGQHRRAFGADT